MSLFAVTYTYVRTPEALDAVRPAHREYLDRLGDQGLMTGAGAFTDTPPGALLVFRAETPDAVHEYVADDPFYAAGLVTSYQVRAWGLGLGPWAADA